MMRSLYSGVSGLKNHQTRMDVIANNISNVNTAGYKASRVVFQDIFSQTSRSASASTATLGGTNPIQIGLGITLAAIDVLHTESAFGRTDRPLDFMIEGEGFFILQMSDGSEDFAYSRAGNFYIDNENYLVNAAGHFVMGLMEDSTSGDVLDRIKLDYLYQPVDGDGNPVGDEVSRRYDNIAIDANGEITGQDADGVLVTIGFLQLATFNNTAGLEKVGGSLYRETKNSGAALFSYPNTEGAGKVVGGGLEMSNVDLSSEMTDMIVTQRGFQANSRVITVSDTMLEELINLKR